MLVVNLLLFASIVVVPVVLAHLFIRLKRRYSSY
jgi:hypothetical protein